MNANTWVLAIDFGTTNTVTAVADATGVRSLRIQDDTHLPSAVYYDGTWTVGKPALNSAMFDASRFELTPKRRINDGTIFLGGQSIPVADAIAAVLGVALETALRQYGGTPPAAVLVTHPVSWTGKQQLHVLRDAIGKAISATLPAGAEPLIMRLEEPIAASIRIASVASLAERTRIAICDLGGGTLDVSLLDRAEGPDGPTFATAGEPLGVDPLGGEDFDVRLARWAVEQTGVADAVDRLVSPGTPADVVAALDLRRSARSAKEDLSSVPRAHIRIPSLPGALDGGANIQVSRQALESLISGETRTDPGLGLVASTVKAAIDATPDGVPVDAVFLVGGSSRIPALGRIIEERTGLSPREHGDPGTTVAEGGAIYALRAVAPTKKDTPVPPVPPVPDRETVVIPHVPDRETVVIPHVPDRDGHGPVYPPKKPWWKGPGGIAAGIAGGLIALLAVVVGAVALTGSSSVTCTDGSKAASYADCPTPPPPDPITTSASPTITTQTPPSTVANYTCWNDTATKVASPDDCSWPIGTSMEGRVIPGMLNGDPLTCSTADVFHEATSVVSCPVSPSGTAWILSYPDIEAAAAAVAKNWDRATPVEGGWVVGNAYMGSAWDGDSDQGAVRIVTFTNAPYVVYVIDSTPEKAVARWEALSWYVDQDYIRSQRVD